MADDPQEKLLALARELLEREKEMLYAGTYSNDQRIAAIEKFVVDQARKLTEDDSKKTKA